MAFKGQRLSVFAFGMIVILSCCLTAQAQNGNYQSYPANEFAHQHFQYQDSVQVSQFSPDGLPASDPIQALEAKVDSLQYQLNSLDSGNSIACCNTCAPAGECGFYAGAAAVFAKPHLKEAFQHSQTNTATGQQTLVPFEYDYEATPRGWFGFKRSDGLGMRATYWKFDADGRSSSNVADGITVYGAHAVTVIFPANIFAQIPGEELINSDSLKTQILNYYGTYDTTVAGIELSGGAGLRHARLDQSLNSVVLDGGGAPIRQLTWQREYEGLGPSVTVEGKKRIGCSPLSVFAQGGGSLLFGTKRINRTVLGDQSPQPASPFLTLDDADEVVGIGELGMGVELSKQLANGHQLSVRGLYEGQLWAEAGAPTLGFLGFEGFGVLVELKR